MDKNKVKTDVLASLIEFLREKEIGSWKDGEDKEEAEVEEESEDECPECGKVPCECENPKGGIMMVIEAKKKDAKKEA
jgi:hypothetical protein